MKDDCIFCKIIAGEVSCEKVYENESVLAFVDASPLMPVHTLVVPKKHYDNIGDNLDDADMAAVFSAVPEVARIQGVDQSGYRVMVNCGEDARQTVHHLHVHVFGGGRMNVDSPAEHS